MGAGLCLVLGQHCACLGDRTRLRSCGFQMIVVAMRCTGTGKEVCVEFSAARESGVTQRGAVPFGRARAAHAFQSTLVTYKHP